MIRFLFLLLLCTNGIQVLQSDQCSSCSKYLSKDDCQFGYNCAWKDDICIYSSPHQIYTYCDQFSSSCAQTKGCAWISNQCTSFAGCTAYVKTTTRECHQISNRCISNGKSCVEALECSQYNQKECNTTPNKFDNNCIWDNQICRNYHCSEADFSFNTDEQCNKFTQGCITTGAGCIEPPLPRCSQFQIQTCNLVKGSDGFCEWDKQCRPRSCNHAPQFLSNDQDCQQYQIGCITTGKGCTSELKECFTYKVTYPETECKGYIGIDGICEGDKDTFTCRSKICENKAGVTDQACNDYKQGCITNGKSCVSARQLCSNYSGTITTCEGYIGIDGKCKGTLNSNNCKPKDCIEDSDVKYNTDELCKNIQDWCLSTGKGCVKIYQSCKSYKDENDCLKRIGLEGKCKQGTNEYCDAILCSEASNSLKTNEDCDQFQKGCVTNGNGCINQTTCSDTQSKITCDGTYENQKKCYWSGNCIENTSCSVFTTKSLCQRYKYQSNLCFWDSQASLCRQAECKDYQYSNDLECKNALQGCVTNGVACADPNDCSQFQGTKTICLEYKAYCTNDNDTQTKCIKRTCENAPKDMNTDYQCSNYLPECLTKGFGCIHKLKDCTFYTGNKDTCKNFTGYINNSRIQCWSNSAYDDACVTKKCNLAESMKKDSDCQSFLTGCKFNGLGSCTDSASPCTSYGYTVEKTICQNFSGENGKVSCWYGNNQSCRNRECSDNNGTNPSVNCQTFLAGCIANGSNCVPQTTPCTDFSGPADQCNNFIGNSIQCMQATNCKSKVCSEKINVKTNRECLNYHSKCRLPNLRATACKNAGLWCKDYTFYQNESTSDKYSYCNTITTSTQNLCAFDPNVVSNCVERKYCSQWTVGIPGVDCANYLGINSCSLNTTDNQCYTIGSCSSYKIPDAYMQAKLQSSWCSSILDIKSIRCLYDTLSITNFCTDLTICENINPTNQDQCQTNCQYLSLDNYQQCITTQGNCTQYSLENIKISKAFYCSNLKADYNSEVTPCKYDEMFMNHCVAMTCNDIISNQSICLIVKGCKYNSGVCYFQNECSQYTVSGNNIWEDRLMCQNYLNYNQYYCSYSGSGNNCSDPIVDCRSISETSVDSCGKYRLKTGEACHYSSNYNCDQPVSDVCSAVINIGINSCDLYTKIGSCDNISGNCVLKPNCWNIAIKNSSSDEKASDCQQFNDSIGQHCSWRSSSSGCEVAPYQCSDWNNLTTTVDNTTFCQLRIDRQGNKCTYNIGTNSCRQRYLCEFALSPKSQIDCDILSKGCFYKAGICATYKDKCNQYKAVGTTDDNKLHYCNSLTNQSETCTFIIKSEYCITKHNCLSYLVSQLTSSADKIYACSLVSTTNVYGCTYWNNMNTCSAIGACNTYTVQIAQDLSVLCGSQKDHNGKTCSGSKSATSCSQFSKCEQITDPNSIADCNKYMDGCVYYSKKCFSQQKDCKYPASGNGSISYCEGFINSENGDKCTAAQNTATVCQNRTCQDLFAQTLTTNLACQAYKSTCKSDGTKCIDASIKCSQFLATDCTLALDFDNTSTCAQHPYTCFNKDCDINEISTTDNDCNLFRKGCLTNGHGCVESTVPCSEYVGTIDICQNFTGNNVKCWGQQKYINDYCRNRQCTDNKTATKDSECQAFLDGCITNGLGCVKQGSPCSVYQGNQETCSKFIGINYNCWSQFTVQIQSCIERECNQLEGKTDADCKEFMSTCVTNGKRCVDKSTICSQFYGNYLTCPTFTAYDGPCKSTNYSLQESTCTPRVCNEAPNIFIEDWQCYYFYHQTCRTTGHGCISLQSKSSKCQDQIDQNICKNTSGCQWIDQCKIPTSNCQSITSLTICMNTKLSDGVTKCAWSNGICRQFTCADYDENITSHELCNSMDPTCTTNGAGCVKLGLCISYLDPKTCFAAYTTEAQIRCTWDDTIAQCRQRQCKDNNQYQSDSDCDKFLKGCKTRGYGCAEPQFTCSQISRWYPCLSDGLGNPCRQVYGQCYNYSACTDVHGLTLSDCQAFHPLCVPGPQSCIAQTSCDQYNNYQSCKIDTNQVLCGWLPHGVCQIFGKCSDVISTSNQGCQNYGVNCITDGIKCIDKQLCSTYLIDVVCINGGTDGKCIWESNLCRLARCTDKYSSSESECEQFKVKEGLCTTDGTQCILKIEQNCKNYLTEKRCTYSVNENKCIFSYPVGQTTGNKSCRASQCEDFPVIDGEYCQYANYYQYCIFDGSKCVREDNCSNYIQKKLCNKWGKDGYCVFTPSLNDSAIGTCQKFTQCEQANSDQQACNRKLDQCYWNINQCQKKMCADIKNAENCIPIPNFDYSQYTICSFVIDKCIESDPSMFSEKDCLKKSSYTYTWNAKTKQCVSCKNKEETVQKIDTDLETYSSFVHLFVLILEFLIFQ